MSILRTFITDKTEFNSDFKALTPTFVGDISRSTFFPQVISALMIAILMRKWMEIYSPSIGDILNVFFL